MPGYIDDRLLGFIHEASYSQLEFTVLFETKIDIDTESIFNGYILTDNVPIIAKDDNIRKLKSFDVYTTMEINTTDHQYLRVWIKCNTYYLLVTLTPTGFVRIETRNRVVDVFSDIEKDIHDALNNFDKNLFGNTRLQLDHANIKIDTIKTTTRHVIDRLGVEASLGRSGFNYTRNSDSIIFEESPIRKEPRSRFIIKTGNFEFINDILEKVFKGVDDPGIFHYLTL